MKQYIIKLSDKSERSTRHDHYGQCQRKTDQTTMIYSKVSDTNTLFTKGCSSGQPKWSYGNIRNFCPNKSSVLIMNTTIHTIRSV